MPYKWTDQETVQEYLDLESTIQIGDIENETGNFADTTVELLENESVFEIETMLSPAWIIPLPVDNEDLGRLAAKLTAAKVGTSRSGSTTGMIPEWTQRYKNEVFAQTMRMVINSLFIEIEGSEKRVISPMTIFLYSKLRDQMVTAQT